MTSAIVVQLIGNKAFNTDLTLKWSCIESYVLLKEGANKKPADIKL